MLLLLLLAQGSEQLHMLVEHHHVCAVHGEIAEGDAPPSDGCSHDEASSLSARRAPVPDHHCAIAAHMLQSARTAKRVALTVVPVRALAAPAASLSADAQQIAILSFAPKHSPPTL